MGSLDCNLQLKTHGDGKGSWDDWFCTEHLPLLSSHRLAQGFFGFFFSTFKHAQGCNLWDQVVYFCLCEPAENTFWQHLQSRQDNPSESERGEKKAPPQISSEFATCWRWLFVLAISCSILKLKVKMLAISKLLEGKQWRHQAFSTSVRKQVTKSSRIPTVARKPCTT